MTELNGLSEHVVVGESQGAPEHDHMKLSTNGNTSFTEQLMRPQESDPELIPLLHSTLDATEPSKVPTCFYKRNGILMRKWRPCTAPSDEEWQVSHQIVVPQCFRTNVLSLAHSSPLAGHLGVNKTFRSIFIGPD